jgi:trigger factor
MSDTSSGSDLQVSVEQASSYARQLSITVPGERVQRIRRSVTQQLTRNARVPGFRKGKLPESVLARQFGPAIEQETMDRVIQETYREALEQQNIQPINQGEVKDVHYHGEGGELHYLVTVEVQPTLEIARTSGFVVARPSDTVEDGAVDEVIQRLRSERATLETVEDRTPVDGDEVQVRITGSGEGAEPQEYRIVLGGGQAIPGIEEAIKTLRPGEERHFEVTFPDDFADPEQAGTTESLEIGLVELRQRTLPELDDAFAQAVGEFDSVSALRERVKADLTEEARRRSEAAVRDALLGQIVEANALEAAPSMVERYLDYMTGEGEAARGPKAKPRTPEQQERFSQFRELVRPQAESALKRMMVIETLADAQGLRATQDEVDGRVELLATARGRSPGDIWLELEKSGQLQALESEITEDKVFDWLRAQNTVG